MLTTLPLEAFVCRSVMTTYYYPDQPFNLNRHVLFTTALVLSPMVISLVICDLGAVFELIGATSASALAYIFPPLCYIKLSNASHKAKLPSYLCIAFGIAVMGVSLLQAIAKMIRMSILIAITVIPCSLNISHLLTNDVLQMGAAPAPAVRRTKQSYL